jgi:antitoxin component of MazEF toxin-antitoxin module
VVIPRSICETLQLQEGDVVAFVARAGGVLIKPKRAADPDDVLNREESARVKKAEQEMSQGRYMTLAKLKHELAAPPHYGCTLSQYTPQSEISACWR